MAQKSGSLSDKFAEIDRLRADGGADFPELSELRANEVRAAIRSA